MKPETKLAIRRFAVRWMRKLLDALDDRLHAAEVGLREEIAITRSLPDRGAAVASQHDPAFSRGVRTTKQAPLRAESFQQWEARRSGIAPVTKKSRRRGISARRIRFEVRPMKTLILCCALLLPTVILAQNDQDEKVTIPKSMLTRDQLSELSQKNLKNNVSGWAGIGREIGEAVNSSLQAITTQSNNFAQTPVGKLTVLLVIWKVIGDQFLHVAIGLLELAVFLPIWIWSYRKMCITRSVKAGKDQYKIFEYDATRYEVGPRAGHGLAALAAVAVVLTTIFSY